MTILGIDVGGSGSRLALLPDSGAPRREFMGERVEIGPTGSNVFDVVRHLLRDVVTHCPDDVAALRGVGIGATGLASLVEAPESLIGVIQEEVVAPAAVAIDAVTAHLGALDGDGGAIVALGTGAIAMGHSGETDGTWHRIDGWGHLLGDRGSGAWLGRRGLETALRAHDGVELRGVQLLAAARQRFGEPSTWPAQFYTRPDRAGVLATFARDIVELGAHGDYAAIDLLTEAGAEAARSALAALDTLGGAAPQQVVLTGGLTQAGGVLTSSFAAHTLEQRPDVVVRDPAGNALDGTLHLARRVAERTVVPQGGFIWT